jgi:hypothetical protein
MKQLAELKKMLEEEPNDAFLLYSIALQYLEVDPATSIKLLKELHQRQPEYLPAIERLAYMLEDAEDYANAKVYASLGIAAAQAQGAAKTEKELSVFLLNLDLA